MALKDDINIPLLVALGLLSGLLLGITILLTEAAFRKVEYGTLDARWDEAEKRDTYAQGIFKPQEKMLETGQWVDQNKTVAAVPINEAKAMFVSSRGRVDVSHAPTTVPAARTNP